MPNLSIEHISDANLAWIELVLVQSGNLDQGSGAEVWVLRLGAQSQAIKPSRVGDTQLVVQVEQADVETLQLIKQKLLDNPYLAERKDLIASSPWTALKVQ